MVILPISFHMTPAPFENDGNVTMPGCSDTTSKFTGSTGENPVMWKIYCLYMDYIGYKLM